ncbi:MAG TPA: hypothetical protein DD670_01180, partial [Planctomycetaceae bacterium]|nr:hypothetical protein [Planctomycetaceae bacterium]
SATETDVIRFVESLFTDGENPVPGTITLGGVQLEITDAAGVTIEGPGVELLTIDADGLSRVFYVDSGAAAGLLGMTITGGYADDADPENYSIDDNGGGIYNVGQLSISGVLVSGNTAFRFGGAIHNEGHLTVADSILNENAAIGADARGGGVMNWGSGTAFITTSTIFGNSSTSYGGGISTIGNLEISNSTISGNATAGLGAGLFCDVSRVCLMVNCTITANTAVGVGGGIWSSLYFPALRIHNSVIAGNTSSDASQVTGEVMPSSSYNLIGTSVGLTGVANGVNGNYVGTADAPLDPMLGPLQNNCGPTPTHAPLPGSPLIDAGSDAVAVNLFDRPLLTDQRGFARAWEGVDIGAVEVQPPGVPVAQGDGFVAASGEAAVVDVLTNDFCTDGSPLDAQIVEGPSHGTLIENGDGTFTYTPEAGFHGVDAFLYQAFNGAVASKIARVMVSVLSPYSIIVTTAVDEMDGDVSPDDVSLREALDMAGPGALIQFANALIGRTIVLDPALGPLTVSDVQITGLGVDHLTIDAAGQPGVLRVDGGESTVSHLTVTGSVNDSGIVVATGTTATFEHLLVARNEGNDGAGLRVEADASALVVDSLITANTLTQYSNSSRGGGIANDGELLLVDTTVSGNFAHRGGAIANTGDLNVTGSTFSGNKEINQGGILHSTDTLSIANSTMSGNSGGGIINDSGTLTVRYATIFGNLRSGIESRFGTASVIGSVILGNGSTNDRGGGIYNLMGVMDVMDCTIASNKARSWGGGINNNGGILTVTRCTISGNASESGGGIETSGGYAFVTDSTISGNTALSDQNNPYTVEKGGGSVCYYGTLTITNSTISGNYSDGNGGGINGMYDSVITIVNSTITGNSTSKSGDGLYRHDAARFILHNSVVAGNGTRDIVASVDAASSHNLVGNSLGLSGITNGVNGNIIGSAETPIDPMLGPLQDNGGPTWTHAPLPGSPLIEAGDDDMAIG